MGLCFMEFLDVEFLCSFMDLCKNVIWIIIIFYFFKSWMIMVQMSKSEGVLHGSDFTPKIESKQYIYGFILLCHMKIY